MTAVRLARFDGVVPRAAATALAENQAQVAKNVKLYSGELRYWRGPSKDYTPWTPSAQTIYKHFDPASVSSRWLAWTTDVDVVPGPSADTTDGRLYFTGAGAPRKTNWALSASVNSTGYQEMGLPAPTAALTAGTTAGSATVAETRAYVYTYVNTFGSLVEESAPSPASGLVTVGVGQAAALSGIAAPPAGQYNWTAKRIYRTISGSSGANYAFVAEIPTGTTTYTDDLASASLGAALGTTGWLPPPSTMKGLIGLPNGVLAGFVGNTVYFSEPFFPHAWPLRYAINVPFQIVALGAFGTSVVVMTVQNPYIITGGIPGSMSSEVIPLVEPCVAKSSVVSDESGVTYASPNGLVLIGPDTRGLVTQKLFRREEWQKINPSALVGAVFDGRYFGFYQSTTLGEGCMVLTRDDVPALSFLSDAGRTAHVDGRNARLFYAALNGGDIYEVDVDDANPLVFEWRSKRFIFGAATAFSAMKVDADYASIGATEQWNQQVAEIIAANLLIWATGDLNSTFNDYTFNTYPFNGGTMLDLPLLSSARSVQVFIYSNGTLIAQKSLLSQEPLRLPPSRLRELEIAISGNVPVRSVIIATSAQELYQ